MSGATVKRLDLEGWWYTGFGGRNEWDVRRDDGLCISDKRNLKREVFKFKRMPPWKKKKRSLRSISNAQKFELEFRR